MRFVGASLFYRTAFAGNVEFIIAKFCQEADFQEAAFAGQTSFFKTQFVGNVRFFETVFSDSANFARATFSGSAFFHNTKFTHESDFGFCDFLGLVSWQSASFGQRAFFGAVRSQRSFSLREVKFKKVPDFLEAEFNVAPVVDDIVVEFGTETKDAHRYFRTLRKLADDGGDHLQSMNFFADEVRARRHWVDKPLGPGMGRYYFGWGYQLISDFGRSVFRPAFWYLCTVFLFARYYLNAATTGAEDYWAAAYLSVRHAIVIGGLTRTGILQEALGRLYLGQNGVVQIPPDVSFAILLQTVVSAVFLFFMALALRNHFKIGR